jgi:hypothetical protein
LLRLKLKIRLEGEDYVLGLAMMGAVGCKEKTLTLLRTRTSNTSASFRVG